jgi:hypothetical protein
MRLCRPLLAALLVATFAGGASGQDAANWTVLARTTDGRNAVYYDPASLDSSSADGTYQVTLRHVLERNADRGYSQVTINGRSETWDAMVQRTAINCRDRRVRARVTTYYRGSKRIAGQSTQPVEGVWTTPSAANGWAAAVAAFCTKRAPKSAGAK